MAHAWLDDLSEDWVSQPGSDTSIGQLPPLKYDGASQRHTRSSASLRLARSKGAGTLVSPPNDSSINILSERSTNEIMGLKNRSPSKPSLDTARSTGSVGKHRKSSAASASGSVVHNTVNQSLSPVKEPGQTPEWRRRLVQGNVAYGEQRDLFCSAAAGLQDMFKPPTGAEQTPFEGNATYDSTLPSSPPSYPPRVIDEDLLDEPLPGMEPYERAHPNDVSPSPSPRRTTRGVQYRLNDHSGNVLVNRGSPLPVNGDQIYHDESCLSASPQIDASTRKPSGQSDTRNEDFSPIFIGKHSDQDGHVDFTPIEVPVDQLKQKLERLRINQMLLDSQADPEDVFGDHGDELTTNHDAPNDLDRLGAFINTRRGGRSAEGSFRHRPLSPTMGGDSSEMLPEESLQASTPKEFPTVRTEEFAGARSPSLPRAPFPSPEKRQAPSLGRAAANGSPLKLFGPYDTFTNQTLLRRISQFEEGTSGNESRQSIEIDQTNQTSPSRINPVSGVSSHKERRHSRFGAGDLEGYEFSSDLSHSSLGYSTYNKENLSPAVFQPRASFLGSRPLDSSPHDDSEILVQRQRSKPRGSSPGYVAQQQAQGVQSPAFVKLAQPQSTPRRDSDGKRPRTSPSKDPTPKRRRTLHKSDIDYGRDSTHGEAAEHVSHVPKRRPTDAKPLTRRMLQTERSLDARTEEAEDYFGDLRRSPRSQKSTIWDSKADSRPSSRDFPVETDRKPSIRTQDFVDQAAQIMAMIRSQVRPPGLASVEESEVEHGKPSPALTDDSGLDSTNEPFSRPPSRNGAPVPRGPVRQENPELVNRLKKYQERSDMGDIISSSMRSMGMAKEAIQEAREIERQVHGHSYSQTPVFLQDGEEIVSDIPNVRLSSGPLHARSPSRDSNVNSYASSTNRSYPTGSSRGSDSRKVIMPESVSHLIPDRVGSMYLDKNNNIWIKKKEEENHDLPDVAASDDSEADPFASIPDLTVDMTKEMQHLKLATGRKEGFTNVADLEGSPVSSCHFSAEGQGDQQTAMPSVRSTSANTARLELQEKSPLRAAPEEELESEVEKSDETPQLPPMPVPSPARRRNMTITFSSPIASIIQDVVAEDLDSLDDDDDDSYASTKNQQAPILGREDQVRPTSAHKAATRPALHNATKPNARHFSNSFVPRPVSRIDEQDEDSTVEIPYDDQRQVSILGENSMISHRTPGARHSSLSFLINRTPGNNVLSVLGEESAMIGHHVGKLSLSPLSEFTLNNSDQSFGFEVSYVMGRRHMETGDGSQRVMSMTIRELVDKLSEVEPCEPFWEDMDALDLADKRLTSLHMLDEFCGKLTTLDASKNMLGHLEGVPSAVRQLKVTHNMLTELTSWDHLMNLQYVDVSGNEVKSLSALKNLVHLRSVKADNNQLTSLDGLDAHDGLLTLRARDNFIDELDLSAVSLSRLTDLDLGGNKIRVVRNLDKCENLTRLRLQGNEMRFLDLKRPVKSLRHLDISDNCLSTLDVGNFPGLHTLHADRNCLNKLIGFARCRRLDSLSLREQHGEEPLDMSFLSAAYEVRKLFLSGNYLQTFEPAVDFLNLQLLDLANCGLQELPSTMGQIMPNLRTLNLNFNAISDLSPLRFVPRMKKLLVAGNRLRDSTAVTELLTDFPHLAQLDLRDNPVTLGFYAPLQVLVPTDGTSHVDPFALPDADAERDDTYASRLDDATRLRRRLHQVVFAASCKRLRKLDGLPLQRSRVLAQDEVLGKLVSDGLLPDFRSSHEPEKEQQISVKVDEVVGSVEVS